MDKPSFEESLRELAARRLAAEGHPTPEDLAAYRAGELATQQHERIKDHLAICEDCSRLFLDLAEFERFEPAQSISPADAGAEASWQRLRDRLKEDGLEADKLEDTRADEPARVLAPHPSRRRVPLWQRPAIPWALAAGLALCVVGLGLRVGSLGRQVDRASEPQPARIVSLVAEGEGTRGENESPSIRSGESIVVDLVLPMDLTAGGPYEVKALPAAGEAKAWTLGPLWAENKALSFTLPRAIEPGDYVFQVFGIDGEKRTLVDSYRFTILPAQH